VAASRAALLVVAWSASRRETARPSNEAELSSMNVAEDPLSHGVLEAVQELGCETSGLVEADAPPLGFGVLVRIGPLKDAG